MTVFELHLAIDQKLQEQGSYRQDRIFPEAKDLALNEAMMQILDENVDIRFTDRESKVAIISPLMVKNFSSPLFIPASNDPNYEPDVAYLVLPPEYLYGANYRCKVLTDKLACDAAPTVATVTAPEYTAVVAFPDTIYEGALYSKVTITLASAGILYSSPTSFINRFFDKDQKYEVINHILDTVNQPKAPIKIYWEYYRDAYHPNSFIVVSNTTSFGTATMTIYLPDTTTIDLQTTGSMTTTDYTKYSTSYPDSAIVAVNPAKPVETNFLYTMKLNKYTRTKPNEPHVSIQENFLWAYKGANFIITDVTMDYIRMPRKISLALNQTCELGGESAHLKVINRAVEILKANIKDESVTLTAQLNDLRTQN